MNILPVVSIVFGILIIIGRAPLLFAPETALKTIRNLVGSTWKLRLIGVSTFLFGVIMLAVTCMTEQRYPIPVMSLGCLFTVVGMLLILIPSIIQKLAIRIWSMSTLQARALGLISVLIGGYLIYLGVVTIR